MNSQIVVLNVQHLYSFCSSKSEETGERDQTLGMVLALEAGRTDFQSFPEFLTPSTLRKRNVIEEPSVF